MAGRLTPPIGHYSNRSVSALGLATSLAVASMSSETRVPITPTSTTQIRKIPAQTITHSVAPKPRRLFFAHPRFISEPSTIELVLV
jgi:hypothetical protein